ncbi:MAG: hypothetical protein LAO77_12765 [Acidobacteriia bacterium]|nr:hypothetical protein [Terriglobia bacterium]
MSDVNTFLSSAFTEQIKRLILGVEPVDAMRRSRIARPIELTLDGVPYPTGTVTKEEFDGTTDPLGYLSSIPRHSSCRHALVYPPDHASPIAIRLYDRTRRFVPRRISYAIPDAIETRSSTRVRRPALYPGAAYDVSVTATGMRGRVTWNQSDDDEVPARWVRVEAAIDGQIVGRAHGDDRGEFLLVLRNEAGGLGDLPSPLVADVTVYGPAGPQTVPDDDPLGDLPLEIVSADPDEVSDGETPPSGYAATAHSSRAVTFELGTLLTGQDKFFFNA